MKKILIPLLLAATAVPVDALSAVAYQNTVAIGYAHTRLGGDLSGNASGLNLKYLWEGSDSRFGVIGSFSYTNADVDLLGYRVGEVNYFSVLSGPSYRFTEGVKGYVMFGFATGELKNNFGESEKETRVAYGLGFQFFLTESWSLHTAYEHTKFPTQWSGDITADTLTFGASYRF